MSSPWLSEPNVLPRRSPPSSSPIYANSTSSRDDEGPERAFTQLLPLCRTHQLTSYDALYLELALRRHLPLATLDESLRRAAKKLGIKLLGR